MTNCVFYIAIGMYARGYKKNCQCHLNMPHLLQQLVPQWLQSFIMSVFICKWFYITNTFQSHKDHIILFIHNQINILDTCICHHTLLEQITQIIVWQFSVNDVGVQSISNMLSKGSHNYQYQINKIVTRSVFKAEYQWILQCLWWILSLHQHYSTCSERVLGFDFSSNMRERCKVCTIAL